MSLTRKRFRIEGAAGTAAGQAPAQGAGDGAGSGPAGWSRGYDQLSLLVELHAMREAISATKREISDLQRPPAGGGSIQRAACELDAVSVATERAATTILGAVEEIELSANLLRGGGPGGSREAADAILDRVLVLYEACNFQDITGQRIRKVVTTLKFVEERLDRLIAVWGQAVPAAERFEGHAPPSRPAGLLCGPALPGEAGHVSQSDVDAFFS